MKASLAIAPALVSPINCLAVCGVPWRTLREFLRVRGIACQRIGRRPVIAVDVVLRALDGGTVARDVDEDKIIELAARRKAGVR